MLLLGPPRSGKGQSLVIPTILDAPGAVLTTPNRPDNLAVTLSARARRGPVVVFDPQGLAHAPRLLPTLRWSPIRGCERPQTAMARAETLVADASRSGVENASFWRTQAVSAVRRRPTTSRRVNTAFVGGPGLLAGIPSMGLEGVVATRVISRYCPAGIYQAR
jgi:hypothetical protein